MVSSIWVGDGEAGKDAPLGLFHHFRLGIGLMIIADQMQDAMHNEMRHVIGERLALVLQPRAATVSAASTTSPSIGGSALPALAGKAGKDSTLVGLSLPRHPALSVRIWASSVKTTLSSLRVEGCGADLGQHAVDGTPRDRRKLGFVRPFARFDQDVDRHVGA